MGKTQILSQHPMGPGKSEHPITELPERKLRSVSGVSKIGVLYSVLSQCGRSVSPQYLSLSGLSGSLYNNILPEMALLAITLPPCFVLSWAANSSLERVGVSTSVAGGYKHRRTSNTSFQPCF